MAVRRWGEWLRALVAAVCATAVAALGLVATTGAPAAAAERKFNLPTGLVNELSGMALSLRHPGVVYVNNDSGNTNEVFALDTTTGALRARLSVAGTTNVDWEALAVGRDEQGRPAVFVGDIGGNFGRTTVSVHRFVEPETLANATVQPTTFQLTYPGGSSSDAESMLLDQTTGQLYIASKVGLPSTGRLFRAPLPLASGSLTDTGRSVLGWATDGAFAPRGTTYAVRSGGPLGIGPDVAHIYSNASGTQIATVTLPAQPQGESMTYLDCRTLLVGSENDAQVWTVPLPDAAVPPGACDGGGTTTTTSSTSSTSTSSTSTTSTSTTSTTSTTVPSGGPAVTSPGPQTSRFLQEVRLPIRVTGGSAPITCSATGLPQTLWIDPATCTISGWTTRVGQTTVTVTARDSAGRESSAIVPWTTTWF